MTDRPPYRLASVAGGHEHSHQGQTLRHNHTGGELQHGYFEHPEDCVPGSPDDGDYHGKLEAPGQEDWNTWAGENFTSPGEITVPAQLIKLGDGERVTTIYDLPGTYPILALGVTSRGHLLYGIRAGKGWAFQPQWIGRVSESPSALQLTMEQVRAEQHLIDRKNYPSQLRAALRAGLAGRPGRWATLAEIEASQVAAGNPVRGTRRQQLIAELARMRDDGEVEFVGPRYRLVVKTG